MGWTEWVGVGVVVDLIDYGNWEVYARGERAAARAASKDMGIPQRRIVGVVRAR